MAAESAPIVVFGANGQVGFELLRSLQSVGRVIGLDRTQADFAAPESLRAALRQHRPSAVVIAAAHTAVDKAESEEAVARSVNATAAGIVAQEAAALDACVIHYSTDYVFSGSVGRPWRETDEPRPASAYGRTKLEGDLAVRRANPRHIVLRTSWVFAARGANFVRTMIRLGSTKDSLNVVDDQQGAPTSAAFLADATAVVLRDLSTAGPADPRWGLYHLTAAGQTTWYHYARRIINGARRAGKHMTVADDAIKPITSAEFNAGAKRPEYSLLDTTRFRATFRIDIPDWTRDVDLVVRQLSAA